MPAENERSSAVVVSRFLEATPEAVFRAWTDPEQLRHWWAPKGATTPFVSVDLRVGGEFRFCMSFPGGLSIWAKGIYLEIDRPRRLVYEDFFTDEAGNAVPASHYGMSAGHPASTMVTVKFAAEGTGTRVTLRHEVAPEVPERAGIDQGWNEMLDRLAAELGKGAR